MTCKLTFNEEIPELKEWLDSEGSWKDTVCEDIVYLAAEMNKALEQLALHNQDTNVTGGTPSYERARQALIKWLQDNPISSEEGTVRASGGESGKGARLRKARANLLTHLQQQSLAAVPPPIKTKAVGHLQFHMDLAVEIAAALDGIAPARDAIRATLKGTGKIKAIDGRKYAQVAGTWGGFSPGQSAENCKYFGLDACTETFVDWHNAAFTIAAEGGDGGWLKWAMTSATNDYTAVLLSPGADCTKRCRGPRPGLLQYQEQFVLVMEEAGATVEEHLGPLEAKRRACAAMKAGKKDKVITKTDWFDLEFDQDAEDLCPNGALTKEEEQKIQALGDQKNAIDTIAAGGLGYAIATSAEPTKRTFREQCLILANLQEFITYKHDLDDEGIARKKRLPYVTTNVPVHDSTSASGTKTVGIKKNASLMAERQAWGFMNQLVQDPSYAAFFNIKNEHLSQLQPMIRLYKVTTDATTKESEQEVIFNNAFNSKFDDILGNKKKRGFGVGIQNFTFSYEGSDPFAVKKSIKAKLSIFASSFDDLLINRGGYRYADLALKTGSKYLERLTNAGVKIDRLADLNFRLKAVVGWSLPPGGTIKGITDGENRKLIDAINNSFVTLNLTPTIHEFEFGDMGQVVFHINYLAYVDQYFDEASFNIFSDKKIQTRSLIRKNKYSELARDCSDESEALEKLKKEMKVEIDNDKKAGLASIIERMLKYKMIYYKKIPLDDLRAFNMGDPAFTENFKLGEDPEDMLPDMAAAATEEAAKKQVDEAFKTYKIDAGAKPDLSKSIVKDINGNEYISWFYLHDLVDTIMYGIDESLEDMPAALAKDKGIQDIMSGKQLEAEQARLKRIYANYKQFRVLLGPLELVNPQSEKEYFTTNLGDIPISVSYFMDWLIDKTLKRDSISYNLPIFLKDLLNNLVRNFLNEDHCFDLNIKQRVRVFSSTVTSYRNPTWEKKYAGTDEITTWIKLQKPTPRTDLNLVGFGGNASGQNKLRMHSMPTTTSGHSAVPVLHVMGERGSVINTRKFKDTYNYSVFYAGRVQPQKLMSGVESSDAKAGIFHYVLGKPNGIVKNIQLSKTDAPGLKEVRFEQEGYDGLMQLREVYDAKITCYGSPNIYPGTYIYVDPRGFAPDVVSTAWGGADLSKFGVGGYFMVTHAENKFGPGVCETEITAKWVAQLATKTSGGANGGGGGAGQHDPPKCRT